MSSISSASSRTSTSTRAEIERAAAQVIEHAAGRADDDFGAAAQRANLLIHRRAAVDRHDVQVRALRVLVERFGDLHRQLARRHEHERADLAAAGLGVTRQLVEQRQRERRGLAGAGRGLAEHVAAGQQDRNGFALNRRGFFVAERGDGANERCRQSERRQTLPRRTRDSSSLLRYSFLRATIGSTLVARRAGR